MYDIDFLVLRKKCPLVFFSFLWGGPYSSLGLLWPLILDLIHFLQPTCTFFHIRLVFNLLNKLVKRQNQKIQNSEARFGLCECKINKYMYLVNNPILCDPVLIAFNVDFNFFARLPCFSLKFMPIFRWNPFFFPPPSYSLPWHLKCAMSDVLCMCTCNVSMKHAVRYGVRFGCCVSTECKKYVIVSIFSFFNSHSIVRSFFICWVVSNGKNERNFNAFYVKQHVK